MKSPAVFAQPTDRIRTYMSKATCSRLVSNTPGGPTPNAYLRTGICASSTARSGIGGCRLIGSSGVEAFVDVLWNDTPLLMFTVDVEPAAQRIAAT